ncbi:FAD-dependent monooxygenase [Caballeronia novacaledonica]|uniref:FAD-binding domain-containing protein n=1 Tax=Caballeronia novacaledonica TaxID=1544861 RepID=A0AA37IN38_9BURK|nr:FAD-dependent monooxygenase [Caballeronia novacaledonica]GJH29390.1 hypothetical protein CBA19CS42_32760 [Caballeronia novacaledonica]
MEYKNLFLPGDAAHVVAPTGAKGMNLAANDVRILAEALRSFSATGNCESLDAYSSEATKRVWRAEHFS